MFFCLFFIRCLFLFVKLTPIHTPHNCIHFTLNVCKSPSTLRERKRVHTIKDVVSTVLTLIGNRDTTEVTVSSGPTMGHILCYSHYGVRLHYNTAKHNGHPTEYSFKVKLYDACSFSSQCIGRHSTLGNIYVYLQQQI